MTQTATLNWTDPPADPANPFTTLEIAVQLDGAPDFTAIGTVPPGTGSAQIPDLADGVYHFRVRVGNQTDTTQPIAWSAGAIVTGTVATAPPAPVPNATPADVTGLSVTFA